MRRTVGKGMASLVGAGATFVIATELLKDVVTDTHYFPGPDWLKVAFVAVFLWFAVVETGKVHHRLEELRGE